jgi:hypothetical protein
MTGEDPAHLQYEVGGSHNGGLLTARNTTVSDNTGTASGPRGFVQAAESGTALACSANLPMQLTLPTAWSPATR